MSEAENNALPYSYHTFLFPFIWKTSKSIEWGNFEKILSIGERWLETSWKEGNLPSRARLDEVFQDYAAYQYFTEAANNVVFNTRGDNAVRCFEYFKKGGKYIITKKPGSYKQKKDEKLVVIEEPKSYELKINKIRLHVYDIGIAVLVFELENHDYKSLDSVNAINEYGRRINFPFLMTKKKEKNEENGKENNGENNAKKKDDEPLTHKLCADNITIAFPDSNITFKEDFSKTLNNVEEQIKNGKISLSHVMNPIQGLLDGGNKANEITANPLHTDKFYIKPCVDDRMFVCCMIMDDKLSTELQGIGSDEISFINDVDKRLEKGADGEIYDVADKYHESYMLGWSDEETLSSRLYKFLYVETDLSCQDCSMKKELLYNSVYRRWINSGTIYGITHHSLMCVNNGNSAIIDNVINPFLTIYIQIAILVLAQRSAILLLEDDASRVSERFNAQNTITQDGISDIEDLQAKYVKVQNQLLLAEVTVQEQGVEIYDMLRKQLYIEKNTNDLNDEMNNLRDVANIANARLERESDEKEEERQERLETVARRFGVILGAVAIAEPVSVALAKLLSWDENITWPALSVVVGIILSGGWAGIEWLIKRVNIGKKK